MSERLATIVDARRQFLVNGDNVDSLAPYIVRSWQRCLRAGQIPEHHVAFEQVSEGQIRRALEQNKNVIDAALPVIQGLHRTMQSTGYFAILTDQNGTVIATDGPIDRSDRRYNAIARVGVDLSEKGIGTSAIGTALNELQPVRLHRGEHFFAGNDVYSCAGAPIFGVSGECVGMLDMTGVMVNERPELKHLVARSTRAINDTLVRTLPQAITLSIWWPHVESFQYEQGLLAVNRDGFIVGINVAGRKMLGDIARSQPSLHLSDVFATRWTDLFSGEYRDGVKEVPLWSGLLVSVRVSNPSLSSPSSPSSSTQPRTSASSLRDIELEMIRRAVADARGNVELAAKKLGISRATVYRKINQRRKS